MLKDIKKLYVYQIRKRPWLIICCFSEKVRKQSVFACVAKNLINRWTNLVLLFNEALQGNYFGKEKHNCSVNVKLKICRSKDESGLDCKKWP